MKKHLKLLLGTLLTLLLTSAYVACGSSGRSQIATFNLEGRDN